MKTDYIILAAGCFWGVEALFKELEGVVDTEVGYTGGHLENPTYQDITTGNTGHAEAIKIEFDESKINLEEVLRFFFKMHDPTIPNRQGNDIGTQYRSVIFYRDTNQIEVSRKVIEEVDSLARFSTKVVTTLEKESIFYSAEKYHQDYLSKNPNGYSCHFVRK